MSIIFHIQILDERTNKIENFDRLKTSYGGHRVITSPNKGKKYYSRAQAEADALVVGKYFSGPHLIEIIECNEDNLSDTPQD